MLTILTAGLLSAVLLVVLLWAAGLRYNESASIPVGLYLARPAGSVVLFCPEGQVSQLSVERGYRPVRTGAMCPDGAEPLGKPLAAQRNDRVDVMPEGVYVNGVLLPNSQPQAVDSLGRPMPRIWPAHYVVGPDEAWVVSSYNARSFDSRYFGPVKVSAIRAHLEPLWIWR